MRRASTVTLAESDRGRVPFALVGVVLLVTSSVAVVSLQTRQEPHSDVSVATAFERAEASTHSALREAATQGLRDAAAAPVTQASDTALGNAIGAGEDTPEETFREYVRLRIYLATRERLARTEQTVGHGVTADASLPPIEGNADSIEAALDRVEMDAGSYTDGLETGVVDVTIEDVTLTVADGDDLEREQRTFTVTVPTTVFEMHTKTQEYEKRLNTGFFDPGFDSDRLSYGFGRKFAVRQYPVSWAKTYFDRFGSWDRAFEPIHDDRSTEILANLATFDVQEATFGVTDPAADRVRRERMTCFALSTSYRMGEVMFDDVNVSRIVGSNLFNVSEDAVKNATNATSRSVDPEIDEDTLCRATRYMMGDSEGELGDPPSIRDITEGFIKQKAGAVNGSVEIQVDLFADASYYEIRYGDTVDTLEDLTREIADVQWPPEGTDANDEIRADAEERLEDSGDFDRDDLLTGLDLDPDTTFTEVVDHVYDVEVDVSADTERVGSRPWAPDPSGDNWTEVEDERRYAVVEAGNPTVTIDPGPETGIEGDTWSDLRDVTVTVENELKHVRTWSRTEGSARSADVNTTTTTATKDVTFESEIDLDAVHSQNTQVDDPGIEHAYEGGGDVGPDGEVPNFERVPRKALGTVFGVDLDTADELEAKLNDTVETGSIVSEADMRDEVVDTTDSFEPDLLTVDETETLESWIENESDDIRGEVKNRVEPVEADATAFVDDDPILTGLRERINTDRTAMVYGEDPDEPYTNPKEKVRAEAVTVYLDAVIDWTDRFDDTASDTRNQARDGIFAPLDDVDGELSDVVEFAQDAVAGDVAMDDDADFDGSPLYDDVTYTIDASPTYLESTSMNRTELPAVRASGSGLTDLDSDVEHGPMVSKYDNLVLPRPGLQLIPWPGFWYATLSTWNLHVKGEYARFEVRANVSDPSTSEPVRYIRDDRDVTVALDDGEMGVGSVTPIDFTSDTVVAVVAPSYTKVPRGKPGIGDPMDDRLQYGCDGPYPEVGPEPDEDSCDWIKE